MGIFPPFPAGEAGEVKETDEKLIVVKPKTLKLFLPLLPHHPLPERGDFKLSVELSSLFVRIFPPFGAPALKEFSAYQACHSTMKVRCLKFLTELGRAWF